MPNCYLLIRQRKEIFRHASFFCLHRRDETCSNEQDETFFNVSAERNGE